MTNLMMNATGQRNDVLYQEQLREQVTRYPVWETIGLAQQAFLAVNKTGQYHWLYAVHNIAQTKPTICIYKQRAKGLRKSIDTTFADGRTRRHSFHPPQEETSSRRQTLLRAD